MSDTTTDATTSTDTTSATTDTTTQTDEWNWTGPDGTFNEGWGDRLPEDLKPELQTLGRYKGVQDLAKALVEKQSYIGKLTNGRGVAFIPGADAKPEEIAAFRKALGAPDGIDGYDFTPEKVPEGVEWNKDVFKGIVEWANANHLPAGAAKQLAGVMAGIRQSQQQAAMQMLQEHDQKAIDEIKKEIGASNYDAYVEKAGRAAAVLGFETDANINPIANHPAVIRLLGRVAEKMGEDVLVNPPGGPISKMPEGQLAKDIQTNPQNPYYQKYQDGDSETVKYVRDLNAIAARKKQN